jgi:hypothetical protein
MPIAVTGQNGDNETNIGYSGTVKLAFADGDNEHIPIENKGDNMTLEICVPRNPLLPVPGFSYVNSSNVTTSFNTHINYHVIPIEGKNVSLRVQISPNSLTVGYIVCFKFETFPDIFQYPPDCNQTRVFCPFG